MQFLFDFPLGFQGNRDAAGSPCPRLPVSLLVATATCVHTCWASRPAGHPSSLPRAWPRSRAMRRTARQHLGKGILTSVRSPPGDPPARRPTGPSGPPQRGDCSRLPARAQACSHCALGWAFPMGVETLGGITCQPRAPVPGRARAHECSDLQLRLRSASGTESLL